MGRRHRPYHGEYLATPFCCRQGVVVVKLFMEVIAMGRSSDTVKAIVSLVLMNLAFVGAAMAQSNSCEVDPVLDRYDVPDTPAEDLEVRDGLAYVAFELGGLRIVDVSDAAHSVEVASRPTAGSATGVAVRADRLFVSDSTGTVTVFDISVPESPVEIFATQTGANVGSEGQSFGLADADLAYVTAGKKGFATVRVVTGCCLSVANVNGDGVLDGSDIAQFIEAFLGGEPSADANHDGVIDYSDLGEFVGLFQLGC